MAPTIGTAVATSAVLEAISLAKISEITIMNNRIGAGTTESPVNDCATAFETPVRCMASARQSPPPNNTNMPHGRRAVCAHGTIASSEPLFSGMMNSNTAAAIAIIPSRSIKSDNHDLINGEPTHARIAATNITMVIFAARVMGP